MKTTQTPATAENEKWRRIRVHFLTNFLTPGSKKNRRIFPESTPALRIRAHLCHFGVFCKDCMEDKHLQLIQILLNSTFERCYDFF